MGHRKSSPRKQGAFGRAVDAVRRAIPVVMVALLALSAIPAYAQEVTGNIQGKVVDSSGAVCVGTLLDSGITEIPADRAPGAGLEGVVRWTLPDTLADSIVTNICFGGPDLTTAFITCSQTGRLVRATWHRPGLALAFQA